jgi:hypothetical protein
MIVRSAATCVLVWDHAPGPGNTSADQHLSKTKMLKCSHLTSMCKLERIHNGPFGDPLYFRGAANDFSYKKLQASRWENALVEYSRRLEEVAVVGRTGVRCDRLEYFWPLLVCHRDFFSWRVRGLPLAILFAADTAA